MAWVNSHPDFTSPPSTSPSEARGGDRNAMSRSMWRACLAKSPRRWPRATSHPSGGRRLLPRRHRHLCDRPAWARAGLLPNIELAEMGRLARTTALADATALKAEPRPAIRRRKAAQGQESRNPARFAANEAAVEARAKADRRAFRVSRRTLGQSNAGAVELTIGRPRYRPCDHLHRLQRGRAASGEESSPSVGRAAALRHHPTTAAIAMAWPRRSWPISPRIRPTDAADPFGRSRTVDAAGWRRIDKAEERGGCRRRPASRQNAFVGTAPGGGARS